MLILASVSANCLAGKPRSFVLQKLQHWTITNRSKVLLNYFWNPDFHSKLETLIHKRTKRLPIPVHNPSHFSLLRKTSLVVWGRISMILIYLFRLKKTFSHHKIPFKPKKNWSSFVKQFRDHCNWFFDDR